MKNATVRLSDLDHKRLAEQATKRGGTVSDVVRDIIGQHFDKQEKNQIEKAEHEKTHAKLLDLDNALASQAQDIQAVKAGLSHLGKVLAQYITATAGMTGDKK